MIKIITILALVAAVSASAADLVVDGGMAYVAFSGVKYESNPDPAIVSKDRPTWSPFFGVRTDLSDHFSLRLGYQYVGTLVTHAIYPYPPGPGAVKPQVVTPASYRSKVHLTNLGLRLHTEISPAISLFASPEVNWVAERGEVAYFQSTPVKTNSNQVTIGAAVGAGWQLSPRWGLEASYRYTDAHAVWSRNVHSFGLSVYFR